MRANGRKARLFHVLHVSGLGANLLSIRRICEKGLMGSFDAHDLYMHSKEGKRMLKASQRGGVYIVDEIANELNEFALVSTMQEANENGAHDESTTDVAEATNDAIGPRTYRLWHRRFAHLGEAKIRTLHKVTTLAKPIPIAKGHGGVCEVCALTKFTNKHSSQLSPRKSEILALISVDICGQLPLSRKGYSYFLEIVDNHFKRT